MTATYVVRRLVAGIPTLLIISVFIFALLRLVPGDPATVLLGDLASGIELERIRAEMGLDKPLPVQYLIWLKSVLSGDLGRSFMTGEAVLPALMDRFSVTVQVVGLAFVIASCLAIPAGVMAARFQNKRLDFVLVALATLFLSVPSFWVGILLI